MLIRHLGGLFCACQLYPNRHCLLNRLGQSSSHMMWFKMASKFAIKLYEIHTCNFSIHIGVFHMIFKDSRCHCSIELTQEELMTVDEIRSIWTIYVWCVMIYCRCTDKRHEWIHNTCLYAKMCNREKRNRCCCFRFIRATVLYEELDVNRDFIWQDKGPDSRVHGDNFGTTWGRQDPVGPHVGPI